MSEIPAEVLAKVKPGHDLESDPPAAMTAAERWTCKTCGDAVLRYGRNVYGSVTEQTCEESQAAWARASDTGRPDDRPPDRPRLVPGRCRTGARRHPRRAGGNATAGGGVRMITYGYQPTPVELRMLTMLAAGLTYRAIARETGAKSVSAAGMALSRLYARLGAINAANAVWIATRAGLLPVEVGS